MQGLLSNELLSRSNLFGSIGGSNIKSVQSGVINMSTTSKDNLIPISNVNLANSICYIVGTGSSFNPTQDKATIEFESSDQVKISVDFSPPSSTTLYWYVVEFNNLKSKQYGTITRPFSYIDITNINLQKSFII
ncbi:hypothetical protein [Clostridium kluyveri]|nr:hypothetical protein [Clostridium kluyveri]UZQ50612.1 hypothetical protein OP486_00035 [Clostridium kluyveri]